MRVSAISVQSSSYLRKNPALRIKNDGTSVPQQPISKKDIPQNDCVSFKSNRGALKGMLSGALVGLLGAAAIVATGGAATVPMLTVLGAGAGAGAQIGGITGGLLSGKES